MDRKRTKIGNRKPAFMAALVSLVVIQVLMGLILMSISKKELRDQIEQRMLDIANTAAFQLNGDEISMLTTGDAGRASYNRAYDILKSFQENIRLDYIYLIRAEDDGTFSFLIDPDPIDPGEFGEAIETTDALIGAANGVPGIDRQPHTDDWGRFYSAYSPVFDHEGKVAGIVGVDFDAEWYDSILDSHKAVIIVLSMIALTVVIVFVFMSHATVLEGEKDAYKVQLEQTLRREQEHEQELGSALDMAYTDPLTGVKSKRAYLERMQKLDMGISGGTIKAFGLIVCDLNGLKAVNDQLGHEEGDNYIKAGCMLICRQFCHSPVFRIGGDEFAVLLEGSDYESRHDLLNDLEDVVEENQRQGRVVISTGLADFDPEEDISSSTVFDRADKKMYERKRYLKSLKELGVRN